MSASLKFQLTFLVCVLIVSLAAAKCLTWEDKKFILQKHNEVRAAVKGKNLPKLKWNEGLAKKAQVWANTCNYWHYGKDWGENIAYDDDDGPKNVREALVSSLQMWMREKFFDKRRNFSCCGKTNKDCCHYTQVLWKDTTSVGCGFSRCENMDGAIYTVCFYHPRGNVPGKKPY